MSKMIPSSRQYCFIFSTLSSYLGAFSLTASTYHTRASAFGTNHQAIKVSSSRYQYHSKTQINPSHIHTSTSLLHSKKSHAVLTNDSELPVTFPRRTDVFQALEAVRKASEITSTYQPEFTPDIDTISKSDDSPVTLADFAVQAVILQHLLISQTEDCGFIAEESSLELQSNPELSNKIYNATQPYNIQNLTHLYESIDLGKSYMEWYDEAMDTVVSPDKRPSRVWVLDPIDGTKGFLRGKKTGGQYCIALALLEDGIPTIGILGCPNLPIEGSSELEWGKDETFENNRQKRGCIFVASRGGGCYQLPLFPSSDSNENEKNENSFQNLLHVTSNQDESNIKMSQTRFCIGVERSFGDYLGQCLSMAQILHSSSNQSSDDNDDSDDDAALDENGDIRQSIRIDSQAKFGMIGRGDAEYYVRLPKPGYREWIWDQAAGCVVLQECGGTMTDTYGNSIDFSLGPKLSSNVKGVLGSNGGIFHEALVNAYVEQEDARK